MRALVGEQLLFIEEHRSALEQPCVSHAVPLRTCHSTESFSAGTQLQLVLRIWNAHRL